MAKQAMTYRYTGRVTGTNYGQEHFCSQECADEYNGASELGHDADDSGNCIVTRDGAPEFVCPCAQCGVTIQ